MIVIKSFDSNCRLGLSLGLDGAISPASLRSDLLQARHHLYVTETYRPLGQGQAERMTRPSTTPPCGPSHYETLNSLKADLHTFITACNFAKHLKSPRCRRPFQAICDAWTKNPESSIINRTTSFRDYIPTSYLAALYLEGMSRAIGPCFSTNQPPTSFTRPPWLSSRRNIVI